MPPAWPASIPSSLGPVQPMDTAAEADRLSAALRSLSPRLVDPAPVIRTALPFYGVGLRAMERLARDWHHAHAEASAGEVLALADALWSRAVREEMVLAAFLVGGRPDARERSGLRRFERWGALLDNWETTDNLAARVVGPWAAAAPAARLGTLERLAGRRNPWLRRLGLVACVYVGRRPDAALWWPRVAGISLRLAGERQAAIPKAISWVLREHTRHCPGEVALFLREHRDRLPAVAVREAQAKLATGRKTAPRGKAGLQASGGPRRSV